MSALRYSKDHEWVREEGGGVYVVGISDFAQQQLGDVVYVELPSVGKAVTKGGEAATVESVKAASEVYAPISGTVTAINDKLSGEPALVNSGPTGDGWFFKLRASNAAELGELMDQAAYDAFVKSQG